MFVIDTGSFKLRFVGSTEILNVNSVAYIFIVTNLRFIDLLEDVFEATIISLQDGVFRRHELAHT